MRAVSWRVSAASGIAGGLCIQNTPLFPLLTTLERTLAPTAKGTPAMPSNISRHTCEGPSDIQGSYILLAHPQHVTTVASSHPPRASGPRTAACYCVLGQESVSDASASPPVCVPHRAGSTRSEKLRRLAPPSSRVNTRLTGASL